MKKLLLATFVLIAGCTTFTQNNGAEIRQINLDKVTTNSSKNDVTDLLGSPSTKSVYGQETWYYISNKIKRHLISEDKIISEGVIAITFKDDKVTNVEIYDTKDARDFADSERITPTAGRKLSAVEQLLGNVGKFNTDDTAQGATIGSHAPSGPVGVGM